jgi:mRNA-degrading endonuclease RelE of RelBE toxin-antitoxin system
VNWRVEFRPSARAELLALDRTVQARIVRGVAKLSADPRTASGVKALKGSDHYRLRWASGG